MTTPSTLPHATVSTAALREGAAAAFAHGGRIADLRGDALGHGVVETARIVTQVGVPAVLVDDDLVAEALRREGVNALTRGDADVDSALLYGLPGAGTRPALRLAGQVLSTKPLRAGEAVSYGYLHRAAQDTTVALVTGGYAQGIPRALGSTASVEIDGRMHPIVGRVAMDVCVVDLQAADAGVPDGAEAVYFGGDGPARDGLAVWSEVTGLRLDELIAVAGSKAVRTWTN
ncbi:alanine racemase [Microbacterium istanbulense]|uniref:Alanine racemase C-terminal domain-containing protein n=1 Tax=Microbacterium istanbulense TaxID=3122049 RepID=A0ABU8LPT1_9MICO